MSMATDEGEKEADEVDIKDYLKARFDENKYALSGLEDSLKEAVYEFQNERKKYQKILMIQMKMERKTGKT